MELTKPPLLLPVLRENLILRPAIENDMATVFLMGQDAWGDQSGTDQYLKACSNSKKYKTGHWSVLCLQNGSLLTSVISYAFATGYPHEWRGLGSLATVIDQRSKGYALICLSMLIEGYERQQGVKNLMLFTDVESEIYALAGFRHARALGYEQQPHNLLLRMSDGQDDETRHVLQSAISYF